jgi:hypothetical protein
MNAKKIARIMLLATVLATMGFAQVRVALAVEIPPGPRSVCVKCYQSAVEIPPGPR